MNKERFEELLKKTKRAGIEKLLVYLDDGGFFKDPASTKYHSCHEGGLAEHSLLVYECLIAGLKKTDKKVLKKDGSESDISYYEYPLPAFVPEDQKILIREDSIIIASLLHDLCKMGVYVKEIRNKKVYSDAGRKKDEKGFFDWQTVDSYGYDDPFCFGHGEKSVYLIQKFIGISNEEAMAIRWHMGPEETNKNNFYKAAKQFPLVLKLVQADMEASLLMEEEE